jgi:hypothetical protein
MTRLFERDARRRGHGEAVTMEVHMARSDRTAVGCGSSGAGCPDLDVA